MLKILIAEDEKSISKLIEMSLTGYECITAFNGTEVIDKIDCEFPDLILLDIMLPEINGYDILEYVKPLGIPTIMVTAKNKLQDKVLGLQSGADDYITKPFEIPELIARIEAVLRRFGKVKNNFAFSDIEIDFISKKVTKNNMPVDLTAKEYELFEMLVQNRNIALFRDVIFEKVWGFECDNDTRTLDLHISRLKKKLNLNTSIKTLRKYGYKLEI